GGPTGGPPGTFVADFSSSGHISGGKMLRLQSSSMISSSSLQWVSGRNRSSVDSISSTGISPPLTGPIFIVAAPPLKLREIGSEYSSAVLSSQCSSGQINSQISISYSWALRYASRSASKITPSRSVSVRSSEIAPLE